MLLDYWCHPLSVPSPAVPCGKRSPGGIATAFHAAECSACWTCLCAVSCKQMYRHLPSPARPAMWEEHRVMSGIC